MKITRLAGAAALVSLVLPMSALAQHAHHSGHAMHASDTAIPDAIMPTEAGDAAFAAIAEVVRLLGDDPDTDWSRVNIDALRQHLVDMNQLIQNTNVVSAPLPDGLRMLISTVGRAGEAALRMVPSHGPALMADTGWTSDVMSDDEAIWWTVQSANKADSARIQALGFFGLMATGDHHRAHHIAIARGEAGH